MRKLVIVAFLIGGATWWFWGRTLEPGRVVHAHLEAIGQHDYERAYAYLTADAKGRISFEEFIERIQSNPVIRTHYTSEFLSRRIEGNVATFSGTVRALGSESTKATYVLVKEGDQWFIQDFRF